MNPLSVPFAGAASPETAAGSPSVLQDGSLTCQSSTASMAPKLIVTVDTEEEGLWGESFPATGNTVKNIGGIPRFQDVCDRLGIRPTYLVDAPVVEDESASGLLTKILKDGRCEIGTHVHPWCNPPMTKIRDPRETYLCNLPADVQQAKIEWLTEAIAQRFGARPTSFRAGRYGLDMAGARILPKLGYQVDSSVIPFTNYTADGGPDFREAPWRPYFVGDEDLRLPADAGDLLEVPVSVGFNRSDFSRAARWQTRLEHSPWRWLRLEGAFDRVGLLRKIKLSPEKATAREMNLLVDRYCERPAAALVMMFHSSSLLPGCSPYVRDDGELTEFLDRIAATCEYCLQRKFAEPVTLSEMASVSPTALVPARNGGDDEA